jgi:methyltransferase OMS1, mitochondrial
MMTPPNGSYDTIIQTMGICSTPNPVRLLNNIGTHCKKDNGRILLLEHGRSHYEFINKILDSLAPTHADKFGCWFNRDIGEIVNDSDLEVVEIKRYNFGTTWWVELRPPRGQDQEVFKNAAK